MRNRNMRRAMPALAVSFVIFAGCAKENVVRKDAPTAAPVAVAAVAPSKPAADAAAKTTEPAPAAAVTPGGGAQPSPPSTPQPPVAPTAPAKGFEKIYFDFDAATLTTAARERLTGNFEELRKSPQMKVRIEGHCDERGSDDYNLALSQRRAEVAQRYLTDLGIAAERLSTIGYGKERPADPGHDEAAWAANRRDEFVVIR